MKLEDIVGYISVHGKFPRVKIIGKMPNTHSYILNSEAAITATKNDEGVVTSIKFDNSGQAILKVLFDGNKNELDFFENGVFEKGERSMTQLAICDAIQDPSSTAELKVKIWYVAWLIPPFRAMTIPPFGIFIKKEFKGDQQVLAHDLIHWRQYKRMGLIMYYFRYFMQLILIGYDTMPMEMEARQGDDEKTRWNYRQKYHKKPGK